MDSPAPAPVQVVEDVGMVAAKYGIMAIVGPVLVMVIVNFLRAKLCQSTSALETEEATRVNVELARLGTDSTRAVTAANTVIADDTDDDDDDDAHDGGSVGGGGGSGGKNAIGVDDRSKTAPSQRSRTAAAAPSARSTQDKNTGIGSDSDSSSTVDSDELGARGPHSGDGAGDGFFASYGGGRL
jgi:hypothetical protein